MTDTSNLYSAKYSFRGIFTNTLWFGIVPKLPSLINMLLLPFITPYLSAWDYGVWGKINAYTSMVSAFCTMGLHVHLTNSYYEYGRNYSKVWSRLNFLLHALSLICGSALFVAIWFSMNELSLINRILVSFLSILPALLTPNQLLAQHLYPLRAQPKPLVLRNFLASFIGIVSLYISVVILKIGYGGFVISAGVTAILAYLLFWKPLRKENITLVISNRRKRIAEWLKIGLPLVPHTLGFALLSSSTRIVMDILGIPTDEIGLFTNGVTMGGFVVILTSALASSLSPQIQQYYRRGELNNYRKLFYMDFIISFTCIVIISVWVKELYILLIRNDELFIAYTIAQVVCFSNLIYPFYHFTSSIITIQKKTYHMLWLAFVPGGVCVLLSFVFIPIYGYKVAAWISVSSFWVQFILPLFVPYLKKVTNEWLGSVWKLITIAFFSGLTIVLCLLLSEQNILVKASFSSILFVLSGLCLLRLNKAIGK